MKFTVTSKHSIQSMSAKKNNNKKSGSKKQTKQKKMIIIIVICCFACLLQLYLFLFYFYFVCLFVCLFCVSFPFSAHVLSCDLFVDIVLLHWNIMNCKWTLKLCTSVCTQMYLLSGNSGQVINPCKRSGASQFMKECVCVCGGRGGREGLKYTGNP